MSYVLMYLSVIVLSNWIISQTGPNIYAIAGVCLFGIAFNLTARDKLHDTWRQDRLFLKMTLLIATGSVLSMLFNAGHIAWASFAGFFSSALIDTLVYHILINKSRFWRVNSSNIMSSAVDSLVFPILAFGWPPMWNIVIIQFACKFVGGFLWSLSIFKNKSNTDFKKPITEWN